MRTITRLVIAAATVLGGVSMASTAQAGADLASLSAVPSSVEPGEDVTISGTGWCVPPDLTLDTEPVTVLGPVTLDQTGAFDLTITAPETPGTYTVTADDAECQQTDTATFVVLAPATTTTTTTVAPTTTTTTTTVAPTTTVAATTTTSPAVGPVLPETGSSDGRLAAFALVALLGGVGLVAAARRQRTS